MRLRRIGAREQDQERRQKIRAIFALLRERYPSWSHTALARLAWRERPPGTHAYEVLKISEEFALDPAAP
jgi:hypothetical protein